MNTVLPAQPSAAQMDRLAGLPKPATPVAVRERLLDLLRRDLVGPHPDDDPDLAREVLRGVAPSTWYLTGFLGPRRPTGAEGRLAAITGSDDAAEEAAEAQIGALQSNESFPEVAPGRGDAPDDGNSEAPPARSFEASSLGLTVLLPRDARQLQARVTWGDYVSELRRDGDLLDDNSEIAEERREATKSTPRNAFDWRRIPREEQLTLDLRPGEKQTFPVPGSAAPMAPGGGLELVVSSRRIDTADIDGVKRELLAVSVFLVNARPAGKVFPRDITFCFQARLQLDFAAGFAHRDDRAAYGADDSDERIADLHYRDVYSYAVGHNTSGDWAAPDAERRVTTVFTNPLPQQEVEKLGADIGDAGVERGMKALADAAEDTAELETALGDLPRAYAEWAEKQAGLLAEIDGVRRREIANKCLADIEVARKRIESGLARLKSDAMSREAFGIMNRVMERANRQRSAAINRTPANQQNAPTWRLFQLAFILLNLDGLVDPVHPDRPIVDLLFFPTGGGKTEAYLGLAAFAIARRRLNNPGLEGAGLSVVMRYTLRLLTLDQLQRAAGLVCALELERKERKRLGDWEIEIGLWVGGKATPNNLGNSKNKKKNTAVFWLEQYKKKKGPHRRL